MAETEKTIHNIKATLIQKHKTKAEWDGSDYIPKAGEIVIYDDLNRIKIGDEETPVNELPFVQEEVDKAIKVLKEDIKILDEAIKEASSTGLRRKIVSELPEVTEAEENIVYMLKVDKIFVDTETGTGTNSYDLYKEYMLIDGELQQIGDTSVDLSDYATKEALGGYLEKNTTPSAGGYYQLYGIDHLANQKMFNMSSSPSANAIPFYTGSGANWTIRTGTPSIDTHCANKLYVDTKTATTFQRDSYAHTNSNEHVYLEDTLKEHWIQVCATAGYVDYSGNPHTIAFPPTVFRTGTQGLPGFTATATGTNDSGYNMTITYTCDDYTNADYAPLATIDYAISGDYSLYDLKLHMYVADLGPVEKGS